MSRTWGVSDDTWNPRSVVAPLVKQPLLGSWVVRVAVESEDALRTSEHAFATDGASMSS